MNGYGNGVFGPDNTLSRAMLAQIIYNEEGRPNIPGSSAFADVPEEMWYAAAITWPAADGVVVGYGDGTFGPNGSYYL